MGLALKLLQVLLPVVLPALLDEIKNAHPDKDADEHKQIVRDILDRHLDATH